MKKEPKDQITVVFPDIHYDREWNITNCASLYMVYLLYNIADPLIRFASNSSYSPAIAKSWTFSEDKRKIIFELSDSYKFHNGEPVTYKDVYNSIKWVLSKKKTGHSDLKDAICIDDNECPGLELDGNKLILNLKKPVNGVLFNLALPEFSIVPEDVYTGKSKDKESLKNLTGPYKIIEFNKNEIILEKNENHPLISNKNIKRAKIIGIKDYEKAIDFLHKNSDVILESHDYSSSISSMNANVKYKYLSTPNMVELIVPNVESPKLKNIESRKFVISAIRKIKNDLSFDDRVGNFTDQFFTKDNIAYLQDENIYDLYLKKPERLKEPLNLKMITFEFMKNSPIPYEIQKKLKPYNINLEIEVLTNTSISPTIEQNKYDLVYIINGVSSFEPVSELDYSFNNYLLKLGKDNAELQAKLHEARFSESREDYIKNVRYVHYGLLKNYRILPLFHLRSVMLSGGDFKPDKYNLFDGGIEIYRWFNVK